MLTFQSTIKFDKPASIVCLWQEQLKDKTFPFQEDGLTGGILNLHKAAQFSAESGEVLAVPYKGRLAVLVGMGKRKEFSMTTLRINVRKALLSSCLSKIKEIAVVPPEPKEDIVRGIIEAVLIGGYKWRKYLTTNHENNFDKKKVVIIASPKKVYADVIKICEAVNLTRNLVNDNADTVTSDFIERTIRDLARGKKNVKVEVLNRKELKTKGLNLILAVNKASKNDPKLIIVKYTGGRKGDGSTAIVGKGMTFDTGGLNLKPTGHIETMRIDMSGAAAVVGTLQAAIALGLKRNILFVVGLAENAIGSEAYKPGDVFKSYKGITVEIGNTDAEGRLVLGDALAYLVKNYKPKKIVDLATLTGACVVALGYDYSGLMSNNDTLARQIIDCATVTDDRVWRLPLYPELKDHIKGQVADIKNVGLKGAAGTISAAEFLRQFVDDTPWAHLDIAGTAYVDGSSRLYYGHGATGVGVRLLIDFLIKNS